VSIVRGVGTARWAESTHPAHLRILPTRIMAIPDSAVADVRAASDLVDVVSERVRLKKQGRRFLGLCPFHNEKSPSFSVDPVDGLYYCFGCLDEDEPVWTDRGLIRIGDVGLGDRVLGVDGRSETVVDRWDKRAPVRELALAAVRRDPLRLTGDHVCLVVPERDAVHAVPMLYRQADRGVRFHSRKRSYGERRSVAPQPRLASEVAAGDYVLFPVVPDAERRNDALAVEAAEPAPMPVTAGGAALVAWRRRRGPAARRLAPLPVNVRTARLFGLWLAEGSVYRGGVRWSFHRDEEPYALFIVEVLSEEFGLAATIHRRPERMLVEVTCSSTHLAHVLPAHFGKGAAGKCIPWAALSWSTDVQRALIGGYFEGDGSRPTRDGFVTATSVSAALTRGLFALGIQAGWPVTMGLSGRLTSAGRPTWRLSKRTRESADAFFSDATGQRAYWLRVASNIETSDVRTVVDLTTTGTHTFTTKLGAVHNCRRGGDVFKFVEETEGVGFLDAVRLLADRAGIALPEERGGGEAASRTEALHAALRYAARFYHRMLGEPAGARAVEYLRERGFSREAVRAFGIGVAPEAWDALATAALADGFDAETLEAVGLVRRREGGGGRGAYDVFRDRLMFPILSPIGKVLGFGGRILPGTPTASADYTPAKYINTPETEIYHKSRVLFGMKQAKQAIRAEREVIVVEGYADVVSLWQAGVQNAVAASGTALTREQVESLHRLDVQRLLLVFDADGAGQAAARKGFDVALEAGLAPYAVTLPDGADPDSFVRAFGADALRGILASERRDVVAFILDRARRGGTLTTPEGQAAAGQDVLAALSRIADPVLQSAYLRTAADALGVYETDLRRELDRRSRSAPRRDEPRPPPADDVPRSSSAPPEVVVVRPEEEALLRLMLRHGLTMVEHVMSRMAVEEFTEGAARDAVVALLGQFEAGAVDRDPFVRGDLGEPVQALVARVLAETQAGSDNWERRVGVRTPELDARPFEAAAGAMRLLKLDRVQEALEAATARVRAAERDGLDATPIQQEIIALHDVRRRIERGEFTG